MASVDRPTCSISTTTTISSQADATALANCNAFTGSIHLGSNVKGTINLDGIQELTGDLVVQDVGSLVSLGAKNLLNIHGRFELVNASTLSTVSFPLLSTADYIDFDTLPELSKLTFTSGLSSGTSVYISNTFLQTLDGFNLNVADNLQIRDNNRLKNISLPLQNSNAGISIYSNGKPAVVNFPSLTSAGNLSFGDIASVTLPSLSFVSDTLTVGHTDCKNFTANKLTVIGGGLVVTQNDDITSVSLPALISAKTISVGNNSQLDSLTLKSLSKASVIDIEGNFNSVSMDALTSVQGSFKINSSVNSFDCSSFNKMKANSVFEGAYTCQGKGSGGTPASPQAPNPASPKPPGAPGTGSGGGLSAGAIAGIAVAGAVIFIGVALGIYLFMRRKRARKNNTKTETDTLPHGTDGKAELDNRELLRSEMPGDGNAHELPGAGKKPELPGSNDVHELPS